MIWGYSFFVILYELFFCARIRARRNGLIFLGLYELMKKAVFFLALLAVLFPNFVFKTSASQQTKFQVNVDYSKTKPIPRIDEEAAMIERERPLERKMETSENKYSTDFWIFLFGSYLFILIFNLAFDFTKTKNFHWFWEVFYTFLAIFIWDQLDYARANSWFPGIVMETVIVVYAFYFYFLKKRLGLEFEKDQLDND